MDIEEDIKIVKEFNKNNRFRDCGRLNNAIDHVLAEREINKEKIDKLEKINRILKYLYDDCCKCLVQSIDKQKVKKVLEDIEDYFDRLNGPDEDMEYIRNIKKELLEDK